MPVTKIRYKLVLEYDGTCFHGFQRQKDLGSVQSLIEYAVKQITQEDVTVFCAGRTDAGVHSLGQVIHFDSSKDLDLYKFQDGVNHFTGPKGCCVISVEKTDSTFHARFSATSRSYTYVILNRQAPSPHFENKAWHVKKPLDLGLMAEAARHFIGTYDFSAFRCVSCQAKSPIRTMDVCEIEQEDAFFKIHLKSRSFLHNQVRIMVGSLVTVGLSKESPEWIQGLLRSGDRTQAGITAPPYGLYFRTVGY